MNLYQYKVQKAELELRLAKAQLQLYEYLLFLEVRTEAASRIVEQLYELESDKFDRSEINKASAYIRTIKALQKELYSINQKTLV